MIIENKKSLWIANVYEALICVFVFFLAGMPTFSIKIFFLISLVSLIIYRKQLFVNIIKSKTVLFFIAFYLFHVIGMLWSSNLSYGYKDLEIKLSFLVFPIVFAPAAISKHFNKNVFAAFIAGVTVTCCCFLFRALSNYRTTNDLQELFYRGLSFYTHPTYLSIYVNLAIVLCLGFLVSSKKTPWKYGLIIITLFLLCILMMLSSRMGIITTIISCSCFIIFIKELYDLRKRILFLFIFVVTSTSLYYISNSYYNRFSQVKSAVSTIGYNESTPVAHTDYNSATSRPELWKEAFEVIKKFPLIGTGTGDIQVELNKQYQEAHFQYAIDRNLNPHNQFLRTTVALGIVGLFLLLLCLVLQFYNSIIYKDWLYLCFLLIILLNSLTESILEVESGILLFNTFSMIFYASLQSRSKNKNSQYKLI